MKKAYRPLTVDEMRAEGYPLRIRGNGGYIARLVEMQPLLDGDWCAVYRYPGGDCIHSLWEIQRYFEVLEQ